MFQPFYIAAHLVALRLFINVFTRNYAAGVAHLEVSRDAGAARRAHDPGRLWRAGRRADRVAVLLSSISTTCSADRYARMGQDDIVRGVDYLMWGIWCLEWFINAFIWVLLIGFMVKNCLTIRSHPFRAPIHVVLHDKLYRPFLQMSAQGSTVVLGFSCVTVLYLVYTGGELTDYLGLGITVALLVFGFVPPWLMLRAKVDRAVARGDGQPAAGRGAHAAGGPALGSGRRPTIRLGSDAAR